MGLARSRREDEVKNSNSTSNSTSNSNSTSTAGTPPARTRHQPAEYLSEEAEEVEEKVSEECEGARRKCIHRDRPQLEVNLMDMQQALRHEPSDFVNRRGE